MGGYFQVRRSLFSSTIWLNESPEARCLWLWILGEMKNGFLDTPVVGMAHGANISIEACQAALERFQAPDPGSRTEDQDGRRIEKVPGGWKVLNYGKYDIRLGKTPEQVEAKREEKKIAARQRMRDVRAKGKEAKEEVQNTPILFADVRDRSQVFALEVRTFADQARTNPTPDMDLGGVRAVRSDSAPTSTSTSDPTLPRREEKGGGGRDTYTKEKTSKPNPDTPPVSTRAVDASLDLDEVKSIATKLFKAWPRFAPSREREEVAVDAFVKRIASQADLLIFKVTFEEYQRVLQTWPEEKLPKAYNMATFFTSKYTNYFPEWFDASHPAESIAAHENETASSSASPQRFSQITD